MRTHKPPREFKPSLPKRANPNRTLKLNRKAWANLRAVVLSEAPLCVECQRLGRIEPAREVDHINNDPSDNRRENLQGLCSQHHAQKTRRDYGARVKHGCAEDGTPLDPAHPWNAEKSRATEAAEPSSPLRARGRSLEISER